MTLDVTERVENGTVRDLEGRLVVRGGAPEPNAHHENGLLRDPDGRLIVVGPVGADLVTQDQLVASQVAFTPAGTIGATDVQSAVEEVAASGGGGGSLRQRLTVTDYMIPSGSAAAFDTVVSGDDLIDNTDPINLLFKTAGQYQLFWYAEVGTFTPAAGAWLTLTYQGVTGGWGQSLPLNVAASAAYGALDTVLSAPVSIGAGDLSTPFNCTVWHDLGGDLEFWDLRLVVTKLP